MVFITKISNEFTSHLGTIIADKVPRHSENKEYIIFYKLYQTYSMGSSKWLEEDKLTEII